MSPDKQPHSAQQGLTGLVGLCLLILLVVTVLGGVMYWRGAAPLHEASNDHVDREIEVARTITQRAIQAQLVNLELFTRHPAMIRILDDDIDFEIEELIGLLIEEFDTLVQLRCITADGEVLRISGDTTTKDAAATGADYRAMFSGDRRAEIRRHEQNLIVTVPIIWEFDEPELLGVLEATVRLERLLAKDQSWWIGLTEPNGKLVVQLGEERLGRIDPGALRTEFPLMGRAVMRTEPLEFPLHVDAPELSIVIAEPHDVVYRSGNILAIAVAIMTLVTALAVIMPVIMFARRQMKLQTSIEAQAERLEEANTVLGEEIAERKQLEKEREAMQQQLLDASRIAGKAEVASSVLHNVGNVLNSVNVSSSNIARLVQGLRFSELSKVSKVIGDVEDHLASFVQDDPRGRALPQFLVHISEHFITEQEAINDEVTNLVSKVEHIKQIVRMQQADAKATVILEDVCPADLIEQALMLNETSFGRHGIELDRQFESDRRINTDRHLVIQILVNLLSNAKNALVEMQEDRKSVSIRVAEHEGAALRISVTDNGVGLSEENLAKLFRHGFTTRKEGHGFGLHSAALAAKQLGGTLTAASDGPGQGATFCLELPYEKAERVAA